MLPAMPARGGFRKVRQNMREKSNERRALIGRYYARLLTDMGLLSEDQAGKVLRKYLAAGLGSPSSSDKAA